MMSKQVPDQWDYYHTETEDKRVNTYSSFQNQLTACHDASIVKKELSR